MHKASAVMYSIANFFTWILVIFSIAGIVLSILSMTKVVTLPDDPTVKLILGAGGIVYFAIVLIVALITIAMVRRAKAKDSSKGWDLLFLILGILGWNIFYILGGIFGLVAVRR